MGVLYNDEIRAHDLSDYVGKEYHGFHIIGYKVGKGLRVECLLCGKQKWASRSSVVGGKVICNHRKVNDYSDPKWIGMRGGSLTAIERIGRKYRFRCDCGTEVVVCPGDVFNQGSIVSCGRYECEFRRQRLFSGNETRKTGIAFEFSCAEELERQGFVVEMTPSTGDYGVDFFAMVDGDRVAFQCKKLRTESVVHAVQEVYAGGRYYDCCKFVVVSPSGFSYPAEVMASKLGVQLERNLQNFQLKSLIENKIDTQKVVSFSKNGLLWEIDGIVKPARQWCDEYGITRPAVVSRVKRGMDLKTALTASKYGGRTVIEIAGIARTKQEWCDSYGISPQLYDYRVKYSGMSPIEALTAPKKNICRE